MSRSPAHRTRIIRLALTILIATLSFFHLIVLPAHAQAISLPTPIRFDTMTEVVELGQMAQMATSLAWSPDARTLAITGNEGVFLYALDSILDGAPETRLILDRPALDAAFSPDGSQLAVAGGDSIEVWDVNTEMTILSTAGTAPIAFSLDGTRIAYATTMRIAVELWDVVNNTTATLLEGHTQPITDVQFSPAGNVVATTSLDSTMRMWDSETGEQLFFNRSRRRPQSSLDFSASGAVILSGARGGILRLYNIAVTTERSRWHTPRVDITSVDFNDQTGVVLYTAGGGMFLWNAETGTEPFALMNDTGALFRAVFSPDGLYIASAGADGIVRLWGIPTN